MLVSINPGSGPVVRTAFQPVNLRHAIQNMRALCREAGIPQKFLRNGPIEGGRYGFDLFFRGKRVSEIMMPGCYLNTLKASKNIPPRVYIDGSSWMWAYAIEAVKEAVNERFR